MKILGVFGVDLSVLDTLGRRVRLITLSVLTVYVAVCLGVLSYIAYGALTGQYLFVK